MGDVSANDPYAGNILTQGLGPILTRKQVLQKLHFKPVLPADIASVPKHLRLHMLMGVRDFHLPSLEGARVVETVDLLVRQGYRYRDPAAAASWALISNDPLAALRPRTPSMAAVVVGHSGSGKSVSIQKALDCYGRQLIVHPSFPRLAGPHYQMVHLSVDVPASGRTVDLAANLMIAWDDAVAREMPGNPRRFAPSLAKERRDGSRMMDEWRQVAVGHFLGVLHLDEVQNFFRIPTLERRRNSRAGAKHKAGDTGPSLELSIIEDQALKSILTLANTWQIPLVLSGTPDGVGALTKRLSNVQRFVTSGYHKMSEFQSATDPFFTTFMSELGQFQLVRKRLPIDDELRALMFTLTAGIQRLIVALWIAAHRVAFERKEDSLQLEDLKKAADTCLAPVGPAVAALLSQDPQRMSRYEDLMPRDDNYWATFWMGGNLL
jgi:hypothetical protein